MSGTVLGKRPAPQAANYYQPVIHVTTSTSSRSAHNYHSAAHHGGRVWNARRKVRKWIKEPCKVGHMILQKWKLAEVQEPQEEEPVPEDGSQQTFYSLSDDRGRRRTVVPLTRGARSSIGLEVPELPPIYDRKVWVSQKKLKEREEKAAAAAAAAQAAQTAAGGGDTTTPMMDGTSTPQTAVAADGTPIPMTIDSANANGTTPVTQTDGTTTKLEPTSSTDVIHPSATPTPSPSSPSVASASATATKGENEDEEEEQEEPDEPSSESEDEDMDDGETEETPLPDDSTKPPASPDRRDSPTPVGDADDNLPSMPLTSEDTPNDANQTTTADETARQQQQQQEAMAAAAVAAAGVGVDSVTNEEADPDGLDMGGTGEEEGVVTDLSGGQVNDPNTDDGNEVVNMEE